MVELLISLTLLAVATLFVVMLVDDSSVEYNYMYFIDVILVCF